MTILESIHSVTLEGTPRERGRIEGETLRPLIAQGMERWKEGIHRSTGCETEEYLDRFLEARDFTTAIEAWAPDLLEEVRGIGEGGDISFRDIYVYQLMDEEWFFRYEQTGRRASETPEHCSTIAVFDPGAPPILAQNMDIQKWYDGTQTLLHVKNGSNRVESFSFAPAGLLGTTGLNNRGVGICCNSIAQLGYTDRGLPVAFIVRRVLEHETLADARRFMATVPHASAQNYAIGGPERIIDLECSPRKVVEFSVSGTRFTHTNHPLANDDQPLRDRSVLGPAFAKGTQATTPVAGDTTVRYAFLESALERAETVDVALAQELLSSCEAPISFSRTGPGYGMTLGSLVMELSVPPVLHIAPGPPAETPYETWTF